MLDRFREIKEKEVAALAKEKAAGKLPLPWTGRRPAFAHALERAYPAIIAEIKKASPSQGPIRTNTQVDELARIYARNKAAAVSVLTEEELFHGHVRDLSRAAPAGLPLLRKDFILDPVQVEQTAAYPASAILLIVRFLPDLDRLAELIRLSGEFGLEPVVEVFSAEEIDQARRAGAKIIQVNNRDLDSLGVAPEKSRRLVRKKQKGETWICASGLSTGKQCLDMSQIGFDACLIGTAVMRDSQPGRRLAEITGADK